MPFLCCVKVTAAQNIWSSAPAVSQCPLEINNGSHVGKNDWLLTGHPRSAARASTHSSHPATGLAAPPTFSLMPRCSLPHILHLSKSQFGFQKEGGSENKHKVKESGDNFTPPKKGRCVQYSRKKTD